MCFVSVYLCDVSELPGKLLLVTMFEADAKRGRRAEVPARAPSTW